MINTLADDFFIHYRSNDQVWKMAWVFGENREAFCRWMLDGKIYVNGEVFS